MRSCRVIVIVGRMMKMIEIINMLIWDLCFSGNMIFLIMVGGGVVVLLF